MQLKPGTLLHGGTYRILNAAKINPQHKDTYLGQGSFGITYLAEHTSLGKKVAIKEFFMKELNSRGDDGSITGMSDGSLSHNYALKFKKEAINLSHLEHPNIVRVTDSFDENGTYYYVMDYIDGMNLNDYIKKYSPSEVTAIKIIKDVAKALEYMHEEKHMLHLDLKPGNIMRRNSDGHIFLIDFGLSKHYDGNGAPETSTTIGLGTAGYAPIEQANQAKNGEFRPTIDVYALGATLYKLLTGETPPVASELVSDDELLKESLRKHGVSGFLALAVVNAMMPSVKKRTQSIRAFIESLPSAGNATSSVDASSNDETEETEFINPSAENEETVFADDSVDNHPDLKEKYSSHEFKRKNKTTKRFGLVVIAILIIVFAGLIVFNSSNSDTPSGTSSEVSYANGVLKINEVTYEMINVNCGSFDMGATSEIKEPFDDEKPVHNVTLTNNYRIGKTEVTKALWDAVMGTSISGSNNQNKPVNGCTWDDCKVFISKLNSMTNMKFRLPTEAEWEFAARGGNMTKKYQYSGSNNLSDIAWFDENSSDNTHDVATKQANELGLYDMSGNVWEFCEDYYGYYPKGKCTNPIGPSKDDAPRLYNTDFKGHILRGGSCNMNKRNCRVSNRIDDSEPIMGNWGFRLVLPN